MPQTHPLPLLTVRRISRLSRKPLSMIRRLLDEHPEIQPAAVADGHEVFDRTAYLQLLALIDQADAGEAAR